MTIGESLKRARKKMGLELDDVARSTKIAKMFLIALENDDISSLPQGVYARNFLRTYARFLKLDEDILTTEYHEQYAIKPQFVLQHEQTKLDNQRFVKRRNRTFVMSLFLLAIPLILILLYWQMQGPIENFFASLFDWSAPVQGTIQDVQAQPSHIVGTRQSEPATSQSLPAENVPPTTGLAEPPGTMPDGTPVAVAPQIPVNKTEAPKAEPVEKLPPFAIPMPLKSLEGLSPRPRAVASLEDVFVIAVREEPVRIHVIIDGFTISDLNLKPGSVRVYSYGMRNSVTISNISQVTLQDGTRLRARAGTNAKPIRLEAFGPRALLSTLDQVLAAESGSNPGGSKP